MTQLHYQYSADMPSSTNAEQYSSAIAYNDLVSKTRREEIKTKIADFITGFGRVPTINELAKYAKADKRTAKPILDDWLEANYLSDYIGSCTTNVKPVDTPLAPPVVKDHSKNHVGSKQYSAAEEREACTASDVFFSKLGKTHQVYLLSCNVPVATDIADLWVARASTTIISSFLTGVVNRFNCHSYCLGAWERTPKLSKELGELLHVHCFVAIEKSKTLSLQKMHAELLPMWRATLPDAALISEDGEVIQLKNNDVHVEDFSSHDQIHYPFKREKYRKGRVKYARKHADGLTVCPEKWTYISPSLKSEVNRLTVKHVVPLRGQAAPFDFIDSITKKLSFIEWTGDCDRRRGVSRPTQYTGHLPATIRAEAVKTIQVLVNAATTGTDAIDKEEARDFAYVTLQANNLIRLTTKRLPLLNPKHHTLLTTLRA